MQGGVGWGAPELCEMEFRELVRSETEFRNEMKFRIIQCPIFDCPSGGATYGFGMNGIRFRLQVFLAAIFALVGLVGCGAEEGPKPVPDFKEYLNIPPGTKMKLVPVVVRVEGDDSTSRQLRVAMQNEFEKAVPGTLIEITEDRLVFQRESDSAKQTYKPSEVRSLTVIESEKQPE